MRSCPSCNRIYGDEQGACPLDGTALAGNLPPGPPLLDETYRLERQIGKGGMGWVVRATHLGLDRVVAIKLILTQGKASAEMLARFRREAKALGALDHPNVVRVTDYGVDTNGRELPYLVMELLDGETLEARLARRGRMPVDEALATLTAVAAALDAAHRQGIVHRDLKPANVFIPRGLTVQGTAGDARDERKPQQPVGDGATAAAGLSPTGSTSTNTVKVLDFGLAGLITQPDPQRSNPPPADPGWEVAFPASASVRDWSAADSDAVATAVITTAPQRVIPTPSFDDWFATADGTLLGTPAYLAPEMVTGEVAVGPRTDLYALGLIGWEMLAGRRPFDGLPGPPWLHHRNTPAPLLSSVATELPVELDAPLVRALAKDPASRQESGAVLVAELVAGARRGTRRKFLAAEAPRRLGAAAVVALLASLPLVLQPADQPLGLLDRPAHDLLLRARGAVEPDPRILLVVLDEKTIASSPVPLAARADETAHALSQLLDRGAAGVAIDLLLPQSWTTSGPFQDLLMQHGDRLTLAALATNDGVVGPEVVDGLTAVVLGEERLRQLFALVNTKSDPDGRVRRLPALAPAFAAAAARKVSPDLSEPDGASTGSPRWLELRIDPRTYPRMSLAELATPGDATSELAGRLVVVGADFSGDGDSHRIPTRQGSTTIAGIELQALAVDSWLRAPINGGRAVLLAWLVAPAAALAAALALLFPRRRASLTAAAGFALLAIAGGVIAATAGRLVLPLVTPAVLIFASSVFALGLRRLLAPIPSGK